MLHPVYQLLVPLWQTKSLDKIQESLCANCINC